MKRANEIGVVLKNAKYTGISVPERKRIRNVKFAQEFRIKKKEEVFHLNSLLRRKDAHMARLLDVFQELLGDRPELLGQMQSEIERNIKTIPRGDETVSEDAEAHANSRSFVDTFMKAFVPKTPKLEYKLPE